MALSKTLIELAMISPKSYAERIRERNLALQAKLMLLKPYLGKRIDEIPDRVLKKIMTPSEYGCPHCGGGCSRCLWTVAVHGKRSLNGACTSVRFNGLNCGKVREDLRSVSVCYQSQKEYIDVSFAGGPILLKSEWDECMAFIDGHIEWTELDCWGSKYKKH